MNYGGLKRAARACLQDSGAAYRRLTLLFLLCLLAFTFPCDAVAWLLNSQVKRLTGLSAMAGRNRIVLWSLVISVGATLVTTLWSVGYDAFALGLSRGEGGAFRLFLTGFRLFDRFLPLLLLEGVLIFFWSMLFMIPGIVAAYRYRVAVNVMLDNPSLSVFEAINASKRLTYGHKLELFFLDLSFLWYIIPLSVFSSLTLLPDYFPALSGMEIGLVLYVASVVLTAAFQLWFMPFVTTTRAHAYNWLLRLDQNRRETAFGGWGE